MGTIGEYVARGGALPGAPGFSREAVQADVDRRKRGGASSSYPNLPGRDTINAFEKDIQTYQFSNDATNKIIGGLAGKDIFNIGYQIDQANGRRGNGEVFVGADTLILPLKTQSDQENDDNNFLDKIKNIFSNFKMPDWQMPDFKMPNIDFSSLFKIPIPDFSKTPLPNVIIQPVQQLKEDLEGLGGLGNKLQNWGLIAAAGAILVLILKK